SAGACRSRRLAAVRRSPGRCRPPRASRVAGAEVRRVRRRRRKTQRRLCELPQGVSRQGRNRRERCRPMSINHRIVIAAACMLAAASPGRAQEWVQYASKADLFAVNFPTEPTSQAITYTSEFGIPLPARVYRSDSGPSRYDVTVVDYADAEKLHTARADACKKAGGEGDACQNDWRSDVQGAIVFATAQFLKRDAKVTLLGWAVVDQIEGHRLQLLNANGSRAVSAIPQPAPPPLI